MKSARPTALRVLVAAALVGAAGLLAAPPASAHNVVVSTSPKGGTTVTAAPTQVVLNFEEAPLPGGTAIVVTGPDGESATAGATVITDASAAVPLVALTVPGKYTVSYRSASDDGHTIRGTFAFTVPESVLPSPSPTATPTPTPTESSPSATASPSVSPASSSDASSGSAWPLVLGGLAVVAVVVAVVAVLRRRSA